MRREHVQLLRRMDTLIGLKATGNCFDFARKLDISKDTIYRLMEVMKSEFNAPIVYNKYTKTFEYTQPGSLNMGFKLKPLTPQKMENTHGGTYLHSSKNFAISQLLRNTDLTFGAVLPTNNPGNVWQYS